MPDKAQLKHNLDTEGANADYAAHDVKDWKQPQRKDEGPGRMRSPLRQTIPIPALAALNGTERRTLQVLIRSYWYPHSCTAPT